jgi:apolipoprotein N-acyltransferase
MKAKPIAYWIATVLVCAMMALDAYKLFTRDPQMAAGMASLGYPTYFCFILALAKTLGILALLAPGLPLLKEWAYAGFTFTFIGALWSHLAMGQNQAAPMPVVALVLLVISYVLRPAGSRRLIEAKVV